MKKECSKCHQTKELNKFYKRKDRLSGRSWCGECCRLVRRIYHTNNREKCNKTNQEYKNQNKNKIAEYMRSYKKEHAEKIALQRACYRLKNKDKTKQYKINNRNKIRDWERRRRKEKPEIRILQSLRTRLRIALKGNQKSNTTLKLVGCSPQQLKTCLESKFKPNMNWSNYGEWHIDHIKPCVNFDLTDSEQQKICFHYSNLQPLWAIENLSKGRKEKQDGLQRL